MDGWMDDEVVSLKALSDQLLGTRNEQYLGRYSKIEAGITQLEC